VDGERRPRLAIVGCGDVARRRYLPTLGAMAGAVELVACCDTDLRRARAAVGASAPWAPAVRAVQDLGEVGEPLDGVLNLTPPAAHADVSAACLDAGLHVFSEKPLATELDAARALVARTGPDRPLLLCAPAVMATARFRWLSELIASGQLGKPTLAVGQLANLGPASWAAYSGDVAAFYRRGGGPLLDQGVYVLHAMVGLLGPAERVQALAATAIPQRTARGEPIAVEVADHWLVQLEWGDGVLGSVVSSFAVAGSRAPLLELHGELGTISISETPPLTDAGPVDLHVEGRWIKDVRPPEPPRAGDSMIGVGVAHFAGCLTGRETPVLTADRALHVLEIACAAELAAERGEAVELETTFS
jgi:predicted dehydrogenase